MPYKRGDIVLIRFPFTSLSQFKKRPVLIVQNENEQNDFICFQITSKKYQNNIIQVKMGDLSEGDLKLVSYVKYDKCFTLNSVIVEKKLASVNTELMEKIKLLFCDKI